MSDFTSSVTQITSGDLVIASIANKPHEDIFSLLQSCPTSTGSGNTYAITLANGPTAYYVGMKVTFKADKTNSGAVTVNVTVVSTSLGDKSVKKNVVDALVASDIKSGSIITLIYDGTNLQLMNVATDTTLLEGETKAQIRAGANITGTVPNAALLDGENKAAIRAGASITGTVPNAALLDGENKAAIRAGASITGTVPNAADADKLDGKHWVTLFTGSIYVAGMSSGSIDLGLSQSSHSFWRISAYSNAYSVISNGQASGQISVYHQRGRPGIDHDYIVFLNGVSYDATIWYVVEKWA